MTHRFPLPDDVRLEKLIEQVFLEQYSAEQEKLNRIEANLLRKIKQQKPVKKLNKMPWWIVLLLAGSFATAAWWAGENWFANEDDKQQQEELDFQHDSSQVLNSEQMNKEQQDVNENYQHTDTPVIYQREEF